MKGAANMRVQDDVRVTFRVDKDLKEQSEYLFDRLGLNMTTALNVFLRKAVEEAAIPFAVSLKTDSIGAGYSPSEITDAFELAVQNEIDKSRKHGLPVARYDATTKQAYLEFPNGSREVING